MNIFDFMYERFNFDKKEITMIETFSGIGSQAMAFNKDVEGLGSLQEQFGFKMKVLGVSEIDKYSIAAYNAIHGDTHNFGSICDIKELPQTDILTYSFPCQDISLAGNQKGLTKGSGTRSGLLWEVERILERQKEIDKLPKVLLMENVKNLASETFKDDFNEWQLKLQELGYTNYWEILNSKNYGIPQNRERVFMISVLGEFNYTFPKPFPLKLKLKDMLEDEVDEKFYLSNKMMNYIYSYDKDNKTNGSGTYQVSKNSLKIDREIAVPITTREGNTRADSSNYISIPEATKKGYAEATNGDGVYINRPHQKRGVVQKDMIQTIKTGQDIGVVVNPLKGKTNNGWHFEQQVYDENGITRAVKAGGGSGNIPKVIKGLQIRKLTPKECWRLMGFTDEDFNKAQTVCSNTQLYKQAGNSIVVDVLYYIFKQLFRKEVNEC